MRHLFIFLLILSGFLRCRNLNNNRNTANYDSIVPFSGLWVNEKYINTINETKSPLLSQESVNESFIYIPEKLDQRTTMIYNFHVGGADLTIHKKDNEYYFYTLDLETEIEKVALKNGKLIKNKIAFIKIDESTSKGILESVLFKGQYQLDSTLIEFQDNGQITGWKEFNEYIPVIDYSGPGLNVDQIIFKTIDKRIIIKGFKFIKDSLFLYDLNCVEYDSINNECGTVSLGWIKYKMKKNN
jgi:hypothetical protein